MSFLVVSAAACASTPFQHAAETRNEFGDSVITADQIDGAHVDNAWDLLRRLVPRYSYIEDRSGRAVAITGHRGRSSINVAGADSPMVIVDGARLNSLDVLQTMPTGAIDRIEIQNGPRGTNRQGTNANGGVIYIHTCSASE